MKILPALFLGLALPGQAFVITLDSEDFAGVTPFFSSVTDFTFTIEGDGPLVVGVFDDQTISSVVYEIRGPLADGTPSGFPAFNLVRNMDGAEFLAQGSSLNFEISATADLSDGLQMNELVGTDPVFVLNAFEFDTGRYHPSLFELNSNGTGRVQNSNNNGPTTQNPATNALVNVAVGEEYITDVTFNPASFTLAVPEPGQVTLLFLALGHLFTRRARQNPAKL